MFSIVRDYLETFEKCEITPKPPDNVLRWVTNPAVSHVGLSIHTYVQVCSEVGSNFTRYRKTLTLDATHVLRTGLIDKSFDSG